MRYLHQSLQSTAVKLRPYHEGDFARLMEIDHACFRPGIAYLDHEMRSYLDLPSAINLVGIAGETLEGFVIAHALVSRSRSRPLGRILTLDVAPAAQRLGLGTMLLEAAESELARKGCEQVSLEVAVDNPRAIRFYKKMRYQLLKVLPHYYPGGVDGLLMAKKLAPTPAPRPT